MVTPSIAMFYNVPGVAATANFTVTGDMNVIIGQNFYAGQTVQISPTHSEYIPYITVDDPNPQPQIISTPASSPSPTPTTPTTEISPPAVLTVTVRDLILQTPIVGAVVTADGNQATTDQNGNATFAQGSYTIQVTAENYFASTTSVSSGQTQVEVDLISYALPVAVGIVLGASAIIVVGAKLVGWW
jgi:PKD repeat protein